jgi:hypothetical protein
MRSTYQLVTVGLLLLTLTACQRESTLVPEVAYQRQPWSFGPLEGQQLTTDHYVIRTTLQDDALIEALPSFVEASYQYYQSLAPAAHPPEDPMQVYLFARREEWSAFTERFVGDQAETYLKVRNGGYSRDGVSVIQYVAHAATFSLFAHEGWHQYLSECVPNPVPAWINEGIAVMCEGQRWSSFEGQYGLSSFDPWHNPARRNTLIEAYMDDRLMPLQQLLETHPGEVIVETSRTVRMYYAQVWALVMFLQHGAEGKYAAGFHELTHAFRDPDLLRKAAAVHIWSENGDLNLGEALFHLYISEDISAVEAEYHDFIANGI